MKAGDRRSFVAVRRRRRWALPGALVMAIVVGLTVSSVAWALGELTQKQGKAGCISEAGTGGECEDGRALDDALGITVSPDGRNVYVSSGFPGALAIFNRDPATGALTQKEGPAGCVSEFEEDGCERGRGLGYAEGAIVSEDGRNVYAASPGSSAISIFNRNLATGALTQKEGLAGCISDQDLREGCEDGRALDGAVAVAESPDGKNLYSGDFGSNAIAIFNRNLATGALTQKEGKAGCISETGSGGECEDGRALEHASKPVVSPDGRNVYVAGYSSKAVAVFDRDPITGALTQKEGKAGCISETGSGGECEVGRALDGAFYTAVSPDGVSVYVADVRSESVAIFDRDPATGELTQKEGKAGCISATGSGGECRKVTKAGDDGVAVSPDGKTVYTAAEGAPGTGGVGIYDRDPETGALTPKEGKARCISEDGTHGECEDGIALDGAFGVAISPDGQSVYLVSDESDAVAVFDRAAPARREPPEEPPKKPPVDVVPTVSSFRVTPTRFKARRGSSFGFTLSEPADVRIAIERVRPGRRVGRLCKPPTAHLKTRKSCVRLTPRATLGFSARPAGANVIHFGGSAGAPKLVPGSYRATIVATDPAGKSSAPQRTSFAVLAPRP